MRNWSDTTTFLVEAEVTRTMVSDMVRQSYPIKFGDAMEFTLPANAEGPCIEAELNGTDIVFPLGPAMRLSWADCVVDVSPDHTKLFQCELKPGYAFRDKLRPLLSYWSSLRVSTGSTATARRAGSRKRARPPPEADKKFPQTSNCRWAELRTTKQQ